MYDMSVSWGCDRFGVMFMTDNVSVKMHSKINDKADEIFYNAQEEFIRFLASNGYKMEMGVIRKAKSTYPECDCFGKPILHHTRAEYECWECPFERECDAKRKEMQHEDY